MIISKLLKGATKKLKMPECKFDFQIICPTRNPNNEFRKLAEKKVFGRKQEKQKEKDQETQANEIADMVTYILQLQLHGQIHFVNAFIFLK